MTHLLLLLTAPLLAAPDGYSAVRSADGITLWEKPYDGGAPDYVLEVDLTRTWVTSAVDPDGSALHRHTIPGFWDRDDGPAPFAMLNGAFFSTASDPTEPAFGLRHDPLGYTHAGYGTTSEYVGQQLSLHVRNEKTRAAIVTADPDDLWDAAAAPEQVVALSPDADKSRDSWVQRTFAGVRDPGAEGGYETLLFFVSEIATQDHARGELEAFGAVATIMLDGGGSSQLRVEGVDYVASTRAVPHAIVVRAWRDADEDDEPEDSGSPDGGTPDTGAPANDSGTPPDDGPSGDDTGPAPRPDGAKGSRVGDEAGGCALTGGGAGAAWLLGLWALAARRR